MRTSTHPRFLNPRAVALPRDFTSSDDFQHWVRSQGQTVGAIDQVPAQWLETLLKSNLVTRVRQSDCLLLNMPSHHSVVQLPHEPLRQGQFVFFAPTYRVVELKDDVALPELETALARERVALAGWEAPVDLYLKSTRSNWSKDGPQGCIVETRSPTGKRLVAKGTSVRHVLDGMSAPADQTLMKSQKVLVRDIL